MQMLAANILQPPTPTPPVTSNDSCLNKFKKVGSCMNTSYFYVLQQSKSVYKKLTALFNKVYIFLSFKFFAALQLTHILITYQKLPQFLFNR